MTHPLSVGKTDLECVKVYFETNAVGNDFVPFGFILEKKKKETPQTSDIDLS